MTVECIVHKLLACVQAVCEAAAVWELQACMHAAGCRLCKGEQRRMQTASSLSAGQSRSEQSRAEQSSTMAAAAVMAASVTFIRVRAFLGHHHVP